MAENDKSAARQKLASMFKRGDQAMPLGLPPPASSMVAARSGQVGALRGEAVMTIQTRQAQVLLTGRESTPERPQRVMGLMQFSKYLAQITGAAKDDDPWADWVMVQVEDKLEAAEAEIAKQQANIQRVLGSNALMDVRVAESLNPLRVTIGFASSHAYWVARVITEYDTLVRSVLTARHVALIDPSMANLLMDDAAKVIRRVFEATVRYRQTNVNRADVKAGTDLAQQAEKLMGRIPADVLDKSKRAKFAPTTQVAQLPEADVPASADGGDVVLEGAA